MNKSFGDKTIDKSLKIWTVVLQFYLKKKKYIPTLRNKTLFISVHLKLYPMCLNGKNVSKQTSYLTYCFYCLLEFEFLIFKYFSQQKTKTKQTYSEYFFKIIY